MIFPNSYDVNYVKAVMEFVKLCEAHPDRQITRLGFDPQYNEFGIMFADKQVVIKTLKPEEPESETTTPIITSPKKTQKRSVNKRGDLKIPFTPKSDNKSYQRAWALCKSYGFVTYPEAIRLKEEKKKKTDPEPNPISSPPVTPNNSTEVIVPNGINAGKLIKYVRGRGKFLKCTGIVKRVNMTSGEILVQFDKGLEWVDAMQCDVVEAKK